MATSKPGSGHPRRPEQEGSGQSLARPLITLTATIAMVCDRRLGDHCARFGRYSQMRVAMDDCAHGQPQVDDPSAHAVFHRQWQTYRKMVDHNYLFHREAYGCLRRMLQEEITQPFRFLDIACGDAGATVGALIDLPVAHYHGIDHSAAALALARESLSALPCPVILEQRDFVEALNDHPQPADVA